MSRRAPRRLSAVVALAGALAAPGVIPARAGVSPQDGYGPDEQYQTHIELDPYGWLPATSGSIHLGNGATKEFSTAIPSLQQLTSVVNGVFMGYGVLRYGPWSAEVDYIHVGVSGTVNLPSGPLGTQYSTTPSEKMTRFAPGVGYQVYNGAIGSLPTTLDGRVGFAVLDTSTAVSLNAETPRGRIFQGEAARTNSFAQPWLGLRAQVFPSPRWRVTLAALGQGFGVQGGSWGWGASLTATYAATRWLNLLVGYRALNTSREYDDNRVFKSFDITAYGPFAGVGITF